MAGQIVIEFRRLNESGDDLVIGGERLGLMLWPPDDGRLQVMTEDAHVVIADTLDDMADDLLDRATDPNEVD